MTRLNNTWLVKSPTGKIMTFDEFAPAMLFEGGYSNEDEWHKAMILSTIKNYAKLQSVIL